jgi:hypothetical protein
MKASERIEQLREANFSALVKEHGLTTFHMQVQATLCSFGQYMDEQQEITAKRELVRDAFAACQVHGGTGVVNGILERLGFSARIVAFSTPAEGLQEILAEAQRKGIMPGGKVKAEAQSSPVYPSVERQSAEAVELARIVIDNLREDYSWAKRPRELASMILAAETRERIDDFAYQQLLDQFRFWIEQAELADLVTPRGSHASTMLSYGRSLVTQLPGFTKEQL